MHPHFGKNINQGIRNGQAKLTPDQVLAIRALAAQGARKSQIELEFKISRAQIDRIIRGERWRHLPVTSAM